MTAKASTKRPRSLVTGACGFMGTHMIEVLHAAGHDVIATDLPGAIAGDDRKKGRFPSVARNLGIELVASDMRDRASLEPVTRDIDYVFHIASVFSYSAPWSLLREVNVEGTRNLIERLRLGSPDLKRFVLWGAGGVYGLPSHRKGAFTEDMAPAPGNDYLRAKWFQEHLVMQQGQTHGLPYCILRPTTVYGPRAVYGSGPLLMGPAQMPVVAVPRNFTDHVPFVHVRDVCGAALYLATTDGTAGEVYNLNDDTVITNVELFRLIAEITGHPFVELPPLPIEWLKKLLSGVATAFSVLGSFGLPVTPPIEGPTVAYLGEDFYYSNKKLRDTGYPFQYPDARVGVRETLEWYRDNGWVRY